MRANLDGSGIETLVQTGSTEADRRDQTKWCVGIALDVERGQIYWTQKGPDNAGKGRIFRAGIDIPRGESASGRSDIEVLYDRLPEPIDLEIDHAKRVLYWTDRGDPPLGNTVSRAPLDAGRDGRPVPEIVFDISWKVSASPSIVQATACSSPISPARSTSRSSTARNPRCSSSRREISPASHTPISLRRTHDMKYDTSIRRIAIVGTGVIGASWAAQYLARGFDVVATDPAPNAEAKLRNYVDDAWDELERIGLSPGASRDAVELHHQYDRGALGGGLRAGERPGAPRLQGEALRRHGRRDAGRLAHRVELLRDHAERHAIGVQASRARPRRTPLQPPAHHSAGRGRGRREDLARSDPRRR